MPSEEQFLNKLGEIPVLNDSWTVAMGYYSKVKDFNCVTKYTLGVAESGVKKAADISMPMINRYQPQIDSVNDFACSKLTDLERKYPLIRQPTGEVKDACVDYVQPVVGRVKPVVTYVQGVVDNGKKRVVSIKTHSTNLVTGARDLGVHSVSRVVTGTLDTPPGRFATRTIDGVLTCAEGLVDKYIPEEEENENVDDPSIDGNGTDYDNDDEDAGNVEEMSVMEPSPERVVVHFKTVSNKLRQRLFRKAMRDFQRARTTTMDALGKLNHTVDLIDYAKKNLNGARDKVDDLWGQIIDTSDEQADNRRAGSVEDRIVMLGRTLASQVRSGVTALEKASYEAGQFARNPITKSKEYRDFVFQFSTNFMSTNIDKMRQSVSSLQTTLRILIDRADPSWVALNIPMGDLELEEDDLDSGDDAEMEEVDDIDPVRHGNPH